MKAVFDTNILIDYLNGVGKAAEVLQRYSPLLVSRVTWIEVLVGADDADEETAARSLLSLFEIVELSAVVAETAIQLRRERRLRLPDALVLACAHTQGCLLITRNTKDFKSDWPEVHVPYAT